MTIKKFGFGYTVITHPLGLYMYFRADHPRAAALLRFAAECCEALEREIIDYQI